MYGSLKQDYFLTSNVCLVKVTPVFNYIETYILRDYLLILKMFSNSLVLSIHV